MKAIFQPHHPLVLPHADVGAGHVAPVSHAALPGVDVLPYRPDSLVFAQIAAALARAHHGAVLVDLPARMNREPGTLNLPLALLPLLSVVVYPAAVGRPQHGVPVSPASPPVVAALVARQLQQPLQCIEPQMPLPPSFAFCPALPLPEDHRVYCNGLEQHFASAWQALEAAFAAASVQAQTFALVRAASALRNARAHSRQRRVLVVHWQLWWLMRQVLDCAVVEPPDNLALLSHPGSDEGPSLHLPDPDRAWASGLLDDYPALVQAFFDDQLALPGGAPGPAPSANVMRLPMRRAWQRPPGAAGELQRPLFDIRLALDRMLVECMGADADAKAPPHTTRQQLGFIDYLQRLMAANIHAVPRVAQHTLFAARACGGAAFARRLRSALLAYPRPPALASSGGQAPSLEGLHGADGRPLVATPGSGRSREEQMRHGELLAVILERPGGLLEMLGGVTGGTMFTVPWQYKQHDQILAAVQRRSRSVQRVNRGSRPFAGSAPHGIDHQATMRSHLRHAHGLVVARSSQLAVVETPGRWTATVFLLAAQPDVDRSRISPIVDASPARRRALLGQPPIDGLHDHVYTIMTSVGGRRRIQDGHVQNDTLTAIGFLFASRLMGSERWSLALGRSRQPCRTDPDAEKAWGTFENTAAWTRTDRLLAWALKYGQGCNVVVCAAAGFRPSARVAAYAAQCRKRLVFVPLASLSSGLLNRLRTMFLVSPNLRTHPLSDSIMNALAEQGDPD